MARRRTTEPGGTTAPQGARGADPVTVGSLVEVLGLDVVATLRGEGGVAVADSPPFPGDGGEVLGRLRVLGELGRGGMGRVLDAWDPELERRVAVKVLLGGGAEPAQLARFVAEARITAGLEHPNICPVHDMGVAEDGRIWFAMKRVEGRSLRALISGLSRGEAPLRERFTLHRLLTAFVQICQAVAFAHDRGVIHRDLKPDNVMIEAYGGVLVMDWGVARRIDGPPEELSREAGGAAGLSVARTRVGQAIGTPGYMSPEQARGRLAELDARSDVFSLGAILYEILTFQRAFRGRTAADLLLRAATRPPTDPRRRASGRPVPDEIAGICLRALSRDPGARHRSAAELAAEVEAFLDGSLRGERARAIVIDGQGRIAAAEAARREAERLQEDATAHLRDLRPHAPVELKRPGWEREDQARSLRIDADRLETEAIELFQSAFQFVPGFPGARVALADLYLRRLVEAEALRDRLLVGRHEALLRAYGGPAHRAFVEGTGAVTLITDPPAEALLYAWVEEDRRLVPRFRRSLGRTPLRGVELPMGSWLVVLRAEGRADVRYPIHVPRGHHWDGVPPGETEPLPIRLPREGELGRDDVYVPGGWFAAGGDPLAEGAPGAMRIWVDGVVVRRFPATNRDWLAFLDARVGEGREAEALRHAPRERAARVGEEGAMLYGRGEDGLFRLVADADGDVWMPDWPVTMITWHAARAYAAWLGEREGVPWRLPGEWEWEKAARGVDGRFFPWGDAFDPTWCAMIDSHGDRALPQPVESYPVDESPYGVRGAAGNMRDWCLDAWSHRGACRDGERARTHDDAPGDPPRIYRGGCWNSERRGSRLATRQRVDAGYRWDFLGVRVARDFG